MDLKWLFWLALPCLSCGNNENIHCDSTRATLDSADLIVGSSTLDPSVGWAVSGEIVDHQVVIYIVGKDKRRYALRYAIGNQRN